MGAGLANAQGLSIVSGNGQVVQEFFRTNVPLVVQATDASGRPAAGVSVNWSLLPSGSGTLAGTTTTTDASGQASTSFVSTLVPNGQSFFLSVVTASTTSGTVSFDVTTSVRAQIGGALAPPPAVTIVMPPLTNQSLTGQSGATLAGGVVVQVTEQAGFQQGQGVPNVGVRIVDALDHNAPVQASCASQSGQRGLALTNSQGLATCNLVISGPAGSEALQILVGEYEYLPTGGIPLTITPGQTCSYSLSSPGQSFSSAGGSGSVNVITSGSCGWTASSNASWITITSGVSGSGNGAVSYSVAANTGAARSATLTIAGQVYTVTQGAASVGTGGGPLTITTASTLPSGGVNSSYSVTLTAAGGAPPYIWSSGTLPPGLALAPLTGVINGIPTTANSYMFTATVKDSAGATQPKTFSLNIGAQSNSSFRITNTSFTSGSVGMTYSQGLTTSGGCVTPFSPPPPFAITSGSLPAGIVVQRQSDGSYMITGTPTSGGTSTFTLSATDACGNVATASFTITITGGAFGSPQLAVSPNAVAFNVQAQATATPQNQTLSIASTVPSSPLGYSAVVSTNSGGNWLVLVSGAQGSTPGSLVVGIQNFATLQPNTYNGTITITPSAGNAVMISVTLTVASSQVSVSPTMLSFALPASNGSNTQSQGLLITAGNASIAFSAQTSTQSGGAWLAVNPSAQNTPGTLNVSASSAGLAPGTYNGSVTITPANGNPLNVPVKLVVSQVTILTAAPASVSISYHPGVVLDPLSISVTSNGPIEAFSASVSAQSGGNWLFVNPTTGTTPGSLTVVTTPSGLAQGSYSGAITVTPTDTSIAPITIAVSLTVSAPPPAVTAVTNAASFLPGPVAPGEFVTIFGTQLGPSTLTQLQLNSAGMVSTTLANTQVFFDATPAPLIYTSATQVTVIVPYEIFGRATTMMTVQYQGATSNSVNLNVANSAPGIFVVNTAGQGAILNQDSSVNSPQNGAAAGSVVSIFATGEGETSPPGTDGGIIGSVLAKPMQPVTVQIGGQPAMVQYAGSAPSLPAGVLQVNAVVPSGLASGTSVPIVITIGSASSQSGVTLALQ